MNSNIAQHVYKLYEQDMQNKNKRRKLNKNVDIERFRE